MKRTESNYIVIWRKEKKRKKKQETSTDLGNQRISPDLSTSSINGLYEGRQGRKKKSLKVKLK
jgi:hypothetical protein